MKGPFRSSEQSDPKPVEIHMASIGLRASSHELPKTLRYKACLAGEILKGKIPEDLISNSFHQTSQLPKHSPVWSGISRITGFKSSHWHPCLLHYTLYTSHHMGSQESKSLTLATASYKMWIEHKRWILSGVRWHMTNISHFLALT